MNPEHRPPLDYARKKTPVPQRRRAPVRPRSPALLIFLVVLAACIVLVISCRIAFRGWGE
jgi:hypothetical protein